MYPAADVPSCSCRCGTATIRPSTWRSDARSGPCATKGVLIVGSGLSFHNLRMWGAAARAPSAAFDAVVGRSARLAAGRTHSQARGIGRTHPAARIAHPQEDHLVPLMVAVGAAEGEKATRVYHEEGFMGGVTASSYRFGDPHEHDESGHRGPLPDGGAGVSPRPGLSGHPRAPKRTSAARLKEAAGGASACWWTSAATGVATARCWTST
jgi:hypothetical protein